MAKTKLPKIYKRKWLNTDRGTAYVVIDAEVEKGYGKYKNNLNVDAGLEIKDCNRQVHIEFYYHNERSYKQRLRKIRLFIDILLELEAFMKANPPVKDSKPLPEGNASDILDLIEPLDLDSTIIEASAVLKPTKSLAKSGTKLP
jgi:acetone carboxylase gamma subunit